MTAITLANSLKCTSTDATGDVTNSLNKFLNKISEGLGDAFEFVDELEETVSDISDSMEGLTTAMSDFLEESVVGFVQEGMQAAKNFLLNKFSLNPFAGLAQNSAFENAMMSPLNGLFKSFGCLGSTIKKAMKNTIRNMLGNMIKGGFTNPIECAVQDFVGGLMGKITNMVSGIIEPLMAPINNMLSIVGKGFGSVKGFLLGGLNILGKIQGLINCADDESSAECHVVETYDLFTGPESKEDILKNALQQFSEDESDVTKFDSWNSNIRPEDIGSADKVWNTLRPSSHCSEPLTALAQSSFRTFIASIILASHSKSEV